MKVQPLSLRTMYSTGRSGAHFLGFGALALVLLAGITMLPCTVAAGDDDSGAKVSNEAGKSGSQLDMSDENLRALVEQLGDADYKKRIEASRLLAEAGPAAVRHLKEGIHAKNPEIVARCRDILEEIGDRKNNVAERHEDQWEPRRGLRSEQRNRAAPNRGEHARNELRDLNRNLAEIQEWHRQQIERMNEMMEALEEKLAHVGHSHPFGIDPRDELPGDPSRESIAGVLRLKIPEIDLDRVFEQADLDKLGESPYWERHEEVWENGKKVFESHEDSEHAGKTQEDLTQAHSSQADSSSSQADSDSKQADSGVTDSAHSDVPRNDVSRNDAAHKRAPRLGVGVADLPAELRAQLSLSEDEGVLIQTVANDSPAAEAGLRQYDVLISMDGVKIASPSELRAHLKKTNPGSKVLVEVIRKAERLKLEVKLLESF